MRRKHRKDYEVMIEEEVKKKNDIEQLKLGSISTNIHKLGNTQQSSMQSFIKVTPSFENKLLDCWILDTYQALMRAELRSILRGVPVNITTDAWTSCNNTSYFTCTGHWIHSKTWLLHHMPLGLFKIQERPKRRMWLRR
jgi:hypothetical protein